MQRVHIVYYVPHNVERQRNEWVIGPASSTLFASTFKLYAGSAAQLLPWSPWSIKVPGSQADGADHRARTIANQIKDVIFNADGDLAKLAATIPAASSRRELVALQRKRLEVLARRQQLEDLLTALRLGAFEGPDDCAAPPPAPAASQACDNSDNDCDSEVGW